MIVSVCWEHTDVLQEKLTFFFRVTKTTKKCLGILVQQSPLHIELQPVFLNFDLLLTDPFKVVAFKRLFKVISK